MGPGHTSVQQTGQYTQNPQTDGEMLTAVRNYVSGIFWSDVRGVNVKHVLDWGEKQAKCYYVGNSTNTLDT